MRRETITKEDGRLLSYYWFDRDEADSGQVEDAADHASPTTKYSCADSSEPSA